MKLWVLSTIVLEIYKRIYGNASWDFCYKRNILYTYSDFIKIDSYYFNLYRLPLFIALILIFYIILITQIFIFIIIIISSSLFNCSFKKGNKFFNIIIYLPHLNAILLKKNYKKILNKNFVKILIINLISIQIWIMPRIILNYSYIAMKIIVSFKKKPKKYNIETLIEIIDYVYKETYDTEIIKKEKFINTL